MFTMNCNGRVLALDQPVVMGIINATPDSFYEGSRMTDVDGILRQAGKMLEEGAKIIDVGAQSTRPGSIQSGAEEELRRVLGALESLHRHFPDTVFSIDTYHSRVALEAVAAGAGMVNDISGGSFDPAMIETVGGLNVPYVCTHIKGTPENMHKNPVYENVSLEVLDYFIAKTDTCKKAGIHDVILDPGFGFAKTITHNLTLLHELKVFHMLEKPMLAGLSRKSTIYKTLGITAGEALNGTTVLNTISLLNGANILRVHDVKEAVEAIRLTAAYSAGWK